MSLINRWPEFRSLMRLDKPVGTYLLLWPTLWALWIAANGFPKLNLLVIFIAGVYLMRAAGCVINDFADRKLDGHVTRTQHRPLATGKISSKEALLLCLGLCILAFILVLLTNMYTVILSVFALLLAGCYPFMKRYTHWPQAVLGAAFAMGIPMGFAAQTNATGLTAWLTFVAAISMTIAYDTYYAMVDKEDDLKIGIKSTAVLFGRWDLALIGLFQAITLLILVIVGLLNDLGAAFYIGVCVMTCLFVYQNYLGRTRLTENYFKAFINNHWASFSVWVGLVVNYW